MTLDYPGGPGVIWRVSVRGRQGDRVRREDVRQNQKVEGCALRMEEGA